MFDQMKRIFSRDSKEGLIIDHMFKISQPCVEAGKKMAEDSFLNGLQKGKVIYSSDIENHIRQENYSVPNAVLYGFNQRMKQYLNSEEIVCFNSQEGDLVYVHKSYVDEFLGKREQRPYIQELFDDFFRDLHIINVIAVQDIPIVTINGCEQRRSSADFFFEGYTSYAPYRINGHLKELDMVLWLFDTFCVLEMNPNNDLSKQFIVLQHVSNEIDDSFEILVAVDLVHRIMSIKKAILEMKEPFETLFFKEVCDFFVQHKQEGIEILKKKYY